MGNKFQEHMKSSHGKIMSICLKHRQRVWRCRCEGSDRKWLFIEELPNNGFTEDETLEISKDNPIGPPT
jgi:hypothetical protein